MAGAADGIVEMVAPVKSATGDSITFWLKGNRRVLPDKTLHLASIEVPRLAQKSYGDEGDEPWAWEAREFMRKTLVAEHVKLRKEFTINNRDYGSAFLRDGTSITHLLLSKGLAKLRKQGSNTAGDYDELCRIQKEAEAKNVGMWNTSPGAAEKSKRRWMDGSDEPHFISKLVTENQNAKLEGIVEWVRDGAFMKIYLTERGVLANVALSGLVCDTYRRNEDGIQVAEALADEGKYFVELRLLQRDVQVRLESFDNFGTIFGSLYRDGNNISKRLVEEGLARLNDGRLRSTENPTELRSCMREAQRQRKGRWANWSPPVAENCKEYMAKVLEVHSGDCFSIQTMPSDGSLPSEKRLYMASVRCPKVGNRIREDEPFALEAKEYGRRNLIGKKVRITVAYVREATTSASGAPPPPASDSSGQMHFVCVTPEGSRDMAEGLVENGLAKVLTFRNDDDSAHNLDRLLELEAAAMKAKKGVHGQEKEVKMQKVTELLGAENADRARSFETELKRKGEIEGIVEHCFNAALYKIRIPHMRIALKFQLAGISVPQMARPQQQGPSEDEPLSREANDFAREHVLQRSVTIQIEGCERSGTFTGIMKSGKSIFAARLLEQGYGKVLSGTMIRAKTAVRSELLEAEKSCQLAKRGVWAFDDVGSGAAAADSVDQLTAPGVAEDLPSVQVVHINSIVSFYIQTDPNLELERSQQELSSSPVNGFAALESFIAALPPKRNDIVIAQFHADGMWYRAQVIRYDRDMGEANVFFVDYGNIEVVELSKLRRPKAEFYLSRFPPQAKLCRLAGVREAPETREDAAQLLHDLCAGGSLHCAVDKVERVENEICHYVVLTPQSATASVNESLAAEGLVFCDRKSTTSIKADLMAAQENAKRKRLRVWQHGDVEVLSEDEKEDRMFGSRR